MRLRCALLLLAWISVFAALPAAGSPEEPLPTSIARIEQARESGSIAEPEALLYKLYALHGSAKLPREFVVDEPIPMKCATQILLEVREALERMPSGVRTEMETLLVRPSLDSYIDTAHFRVHYATSGVNMIYGWPNTTYRDAVADACEGSWSFYHTTKGWPVPPSDGTAGGGSGLIDCYVTNLSGVYGWTQSENSVPGGYQNDYTAYFAIDNDYAGFGYPTPYPPMQVTVAHEYHHVVQMGLNAISAGWLMENTSTFMEDEVFDDVNDNYNYLACYFGAPYNRLQMANGCWEYACFIWPTYLAENWDHSVVRDVWVSLATTLNPYTSFDTILAPYGKNLDTGVAEWTRWNVYTGTRDDGSHYVEGAAYNRYVNYDNTVNTYPRTDVHPTSGKMPQGLGANYTRFLRQTGSTDNKIVISYDMLNACSYNHVISFVRKFQNEATWEEYDVAVNSAGHADFELTRWDETEYMFMVVPMKRACGSLGKDFKFDASTEQAADVEDLVRPTRIVRLDQNQPNPFNPVTSIEYAIARPGQVSIEIHDASGRLVRRLVDGEQSAGEHRARWFGEDDRGAVVPAGLYFYTIRSGGESETRKMILVD